MPPFHVTLDDARRCAVARVAGELDIATTPQLEDVLERVVESGAPFIIDLTETTFCDSTGMTAVLRAHKRAAQAGVPMGVICPEANTEVTRVIRLLGFDGVFRLHEQLETALEDLCGADAAGSGSDGS